MRTCVNSGVSQSTGLVWTGPPAAVLVAVPCTGTQLAHLLSLPYTPRRPCLPLPSRRCLRLSTRLDTSRRPGLALEVSQHAADLTDARKAFERALELDPQYRTALLSLAAFHTKHVRTTSDLLGTTGCGRVARSSSSEEDDLFVPEC
jgi:hypothetical protein